MGDDRSVSVSEWKEAQRYFYFLLPISARVVVIVIHPIQPSLVWLTLLVNSSISRGMSSAVEVATLMRDTGDGMIL